MVEFRIIRFFVLTGFFLLSIMAFGQESDDFPCYEILHLDFFGLEEIEVPKWPESETEGLKELISKQQKRDTSLNVNFTLPIIAYQLQEFYPRCAESPDMNYLSRIIDLYFMIRRQDQDAIMNSSVEEKIDFIRDDFYELLKVDDNLLKLSFTMDDGPFYGIDTEEPGTILNSLDANFGELVISNFEGLNILSALDENGAVIWRKVITGLDDRALGKITPAAPSVKETSLATVFYLYAGERLTLYVKNDGQFMYYLHSW